MNEHTQIFARETVEGAFEEAFPLIKKHWREIAHYQDIPLEPQYEEYVKLDRLGFVRVYTARKFKKIVGYAVYFVKHNMHYASSLQAVQDILYIDPGHRGTGGRFILWCDEQLKAEGVQAVYHHVKREHNFGPLLERFGYELVDLIYARRLD